MPTTSLRRRGALLLAAACLMGSPTGHAVEAVKLKLASFEPPMANITANVLTPFARDAGTRSAGALDVAVYAGGTLGRNPTQQLKLVMDGVADLAWVVLAYTPGRFDDTDVVGLPFLTANATEASVALHRLYANNTLTGFNGLKVLALGATPPVVLHGNKPVRLPTDLKGKRVRGSGDHITRVIEALGGAPVLVGGGQIAESLSRGVIDQTLNNWGFVGDFKVNEVSSEHFELPLGAVAVALVMKQERYDALPPTARAALDQAGGEALARRIGEAFDRQEAEVRERVSKSGRNQVVKPNAEQMAAWKQLIEPVNETWRKAKPRNERAYAAFTAELQRERGRK